MRMKVFFLSFLICLTLGHSRPGLADSSTPATMDYLQEQGWTEVSPGVMQRSLGGNRIETLGFGAAGLRFQLQEMEANLVDLREEYAKHPSQQLRITIRAHRAQILRVEEALKKAKTTDDGLESSAEGLIAQGPDCSANYDASAVAFPLAQGAGAKATAFFNNTCGYTGEVYAHSSSRATAVDNSVTLNTQSDPALGTPRTGANVSAGSSTIANGVSECYSTAYASVTNYDLEITYAQNDSNFSCVESLPSPWAKTDVGTVGPAGGASYENGVFRLIAGGNDLAGTADAFHFVHQPFTGDATIVANVAALLKPAGATRALAGVTFRNDLTAGSAHATVTITSEGEAQFRRRTLASSTTASDGTATTFTPQWLKLVRSGNVFTAYLSANGTTWTQVHTPQTVSMNGTVYVGLVALRNGAGAATGAARFENVGVTPGTPGNPPYTVINGKIGFGTASPTDRLHLFENADANTFLRVENPNTGLDAAAVLSAKSDVAMLNLIAHSSTRTTSRFGKTLGGWTELLSAYNSNGLAIGTAYPKSLVLGTNGTNRMEIGGNGGVTITGNLAITGNITVSGVKNFAVPDPADSQRAIYFTALEGPEAGTYFRGTDKLKEGEAVIELPGYFSRVTEPEQLTVQLTLLGHWGQIYVAEKSAERLVIRAAPGTPDLEFDFLVQGIRRGYLDYEVERPNTLPQ